MLQSSGAHFTEDLKPEIFISFTLIHAKKYVVHRQRDLAHQLNIEVKVTTMKLTSDCQKPNCYN